MHAKSLAGQETGFGSPEDCLHETLSYSHHHHLVSIFDLFENLNLNNLIAEVGKLIFVLEKFTDGFRKNLFDTIPKLKGTTLQNP